MYTLILKTEGINKIISLKLIKLKLSPSNVFNLNQIINWQHGKFELNPTYSKNWALNVGFQCVLCFTM